MRSFDDEKSPKVKIDNVDITHITKGKLQKVLFLSTDWERTIEAGNVN